jgi:hypothetical protein
VIVGDRSRSCFTFAYPATRESANNTAIKITIAAVTKTSRSADNRRIGNSYTKL